MNAISNNLGVSNSNIFDMDYGVKLDFDFEPPVIGGDFLLADAKSGGDIFAAQDPWAQTKTTYEKTPYGLAGQATSKTAAERGNNVDSSANAFMGLGGSYGLSINNAFSETGETNAKGNVEMSMGPQHIKGSANGYSSAVGTGDNIAQSISGLVFP